ncbi:nucleolar and coiled-body phosphoprotein 1-like [Coffea eugenioides]|uniref:nucleolar and coiled-body phosphoprotein 1-like n=1 Tax=Coffea eugenioides TaxID=49369 RepID=UPI000F6116BA|nr:nucleolar and coiled-body phosphoprotein 1-like [Coffea eugenioides]
MVRIRGGSTSAGRSFRLRDENIKFVKPSTKAPKKKIVTRGGKVKQTAQRKRVSPTAEPSDEQMEEQNSKENTNERNIAENQQTPEPFTKKSPRTRTEAQNIGSSATQTSKRKRSAKDPLSQPFLLKISTDSRRKLSYGKFLTPIFAHFEIPFSEKSPKDSASTVFSKAYFERKNLRFFDGHWCYKETVAESRRKNFHETPVTPRTPRDQSDYVSPFTIHPRKSASKSLSSNSEKEPRPEPTGPTTGTEATPASSSQPKDKGKAPATEEAYEEDDEETEEEVAPEQFRLARRRPGSSKITI